MVQIIKIKEEYPDLVSDDAIKFRDDLIEIEEEISKDVVLDLEGVGQLNSVIVSAIIHSYTTLMNRGLSLSVVNSGDKNRMIFEMLNVTGILN